MAEKPMLFNTEMVRAILDGSKTQTRRLVKNIPLQEPYFEVVDGTPYACDGDGEWHPAVEFSPIQKGDVLYVRETFVKDVGRYMYKANYSDTEKFYMNGREIKMVWRPSIHMPKEAARLFLRVKDVRIERLQDMSIEDALAEGINRNGLLTVFGPIEYNKAKVWGRMGTLWNSTIKPADLPKYGWEANPWVWRYTFERYTQGG